MSRSSRAKKVEEKSELLETLAHANKQYGASTTRIASTYVQPDRIPTGVFVLDFALLGGIPASRASLLVGNRHAGKSLMSSKIIASTQRLYPDKRCVLIDLEGTFEPVFASMLGVDCDNLIVVEPDTGEIAVDMAEAILASWETSLLVIDSLAALTPLKEIDSSAEDAHVGIQARLIGGMIRRVTALMLRERKRGHYVTPLYINQFRCIDKKSNIWSERGLLLAEEVRPGDRIHTPSGYRQVLATEDTGKVSGIEIRAKGASSLRMSCTHRHMIIDEFGVFREEFADGLKEGDWVLLSNGTDILSESTMPPLHPEFLGAYFADGCTTCAAGRSDYRVAIAEKDGFRKSLVEGVMRSLFEEAGSYSGVNNSVGLAGKAIIDRYDAGYKGKKKTIPLEVRKASRDDVRKFLRYASFDTHGFVRNRFIWTFESQRQAEDMQSLLLGFGVVASLVKGGTGKYNYLAVSTSDAKIFSEKVGFSEPLKAMADFQETSGGARGKYDVVPHSLGSRIFKRVKTAISNPSYVRHYAAISLCVKQGLNVSRERLLEFCMAASAKLSGPYDFLSEDIDLLSRYRFAEIFEIKNLESIDVVDLEVEGGLFFANGMLTHNSKIGGFQKFGDPTTLPGGRALEHSTSLQMTIRNKENKGRNAVGLETMTINEHSYTINKNKVNNGTRTGEFTFVREEGAIDGVERGEVDNAPTLLAYAKKFNLYTGAGKSQHLEFDSRSYSFGKQDECIQLLREDRELAWGLRNFIIAAQAKMQGMPDEFCKRILDTPCVLGHYSSELESESDVELDEQTIE